MECYDGSNVTSIKNFDCHRAVFSVWAGDDKLIGNVPLPNITLWLSHDDDQPVKVMVGDHNWITVLPKERITLRSSVLGKAEISFPNDDSLDEPKFFLLPSFADPEEALAFNIKSHVLYEIAHLSGRSKYYNITLYSIYSLRSRHLLFSLMY
jgi:hypothetical protein